MTDRGHPAVEISAAGQAHGKLVLVIDQSAAAKR
jgi:hypothetical protein